MRAGLLSQPEVIRTINQRFVSTTITSFDVLRRARQGDGLAQEVAPHWSYPVSLMFLTPEGRFVNRLNPIRDFTDIHPDTDLRPGQRYNANPEGNTRRFLQHLDAFFGKSAS